MFPGDDPDAYTFVRGVEDRSARGEGHEPSGRPAWHDCEATSKRSKLRRHGLSANRMLQIPRAYAKAFRRSGHKNIPPGLPYRVKFDDDTPVQRGPYIRTGDGTVQGLDDEAFTRLRTARRLQLSLLQSQGPQLTFDFDVTGATFYQRHSLRKITERRAVNKQRWADRSLRRTRAPARKRGRKKAP